MQTPLSVEELAIDDSFINYCYRRNQSDMLYWEKYLLIFPDQKNNVEDARNIVLGISDMFQHQRGNYRQLNINFSIGLVLFTFYRYGFPAIGDDGFFIGF